jgi:MerR family mercuric resistance operon transcriptional regulator
MRIGELARLFGVRPATLRYYERRGLLSRPARTDAGYRSYTSESAAQLRLIHWAKGLGFTLREIGDMTEAIGQHAAGRGDGVRSQVRAKIAEMDAKLRQLSSIRAELERLAACHCRRDCPVIRSIVVGATSRPARRR